MKIGQIWKSKNSEGGWAIKNELDPDFNILFGYWGFISVIYLAEKRPNDLWVIYYLKNTEEQYKGGLEDINEIGITSLTDEAWEQVKIAHEINADYVFFNCVGGPEEAIGRNFTNGKFLISGDNIRKAFELMTEAKAYISPPIS